MIFRINLSSKPLKNFVCCFVLNLPFYLLQFLNSIWPFIPVPQSMFLSPVISLWSSRDTQLSSHLAASPRFGVSCWGGAGTGRCKPSPAQSLLLVVEMLGCSHSQKTANSEGISVLLTPVLSRTLLQQELLENTCAEQSVTGSKSSPS